MKFFNCSKRMPTALAFMLLLTVLCSKNVNAQYEETEIEVPFPTNPDQWVNSSPLTKEKLAGKSVVFWFYEEGCPTCRAQWPGMLEVSKEFSNTPVLFVAVNSGRTKEEVRKYVRSNKIKWPVIVDQDRSFESACRVDEISLQNICQCRILFSNGKLRHANFDLTKNAERAAEGAKWTIDPTSVPEELQGICRDLEFGNYFRAGKALQIAMDSEDPEVKSSAKEMQARVAKIILNDVSKIKSLSNDGQHWIAFKKANALKSSYPSFEMPSELQKVLTELKSKDAIVNERRAASKLRSAIKKGKRGSKNNVKQAITMLKKNDQRLSGYGSCC